MPDIRARRISNDVKLLEAWIATRDFASMERIGDEIVVDLDVQGLGWSEEEGVHPLQKHRFSIYMHREYPRLPPKVTCLTETFHPNLLPASEGGAVCLGPWRPSGSLIAIVEYLLALIAYNSYNVADPLNERCAFWMRTNDPHQTLGGNR